MSRHISLHVYLMYYEQNCHIGDFFDADHQIVRSYKTIHKVDVSFVQPSSCQHVGTMKTMSFWKHLIVPRSSLINLCHGLKLLQTRQTKVEGPKSLMTKSGLLTAEEFPVVHARKERGIDLV